MLTPYWSDPDGQVQLYLGDCREVLPALTLQVDAIVTDPPYAETSLLWDQWPDAWPALAATAARSMWCFGSMRMFLDRGADFTSAGWKLSQDIVWEKHNGSGFQNDRFKRVHEHALHWYLGDWRDQHHDVPTTADAMAKAVRRKQRPTHLGDIGRGSFTSEDGGPRLMRSVIAMRSMHGRALHPTEKPVGLLDPLIRYTCPPGGTVLDLFAGSGSTLDTARQAGRHAIGIEADERYCDATAKRLSQMTLGESTSAATQ